MGDSDSAEQALPTQSGPDDSTKSSETTLGLEDVCDEVDGTPARTRLDALAEPGEVDVKSESEEPTVQAEELVKAQSGSVGAIHNHYCTDLLEAAATLQSICNVQDTTITLIESKEKALVELRESYQLEEILDEAQRYLEKLVGLKREMTSLSKKSKDLSRRAACVKSVREKEKTKKEQERKRLERLEQDLAPRYSSDLA